MKAVRWTAAALAALVAGFLYASLVRQAQSSLFLFGGDNRVQPCNGGGPSNG